MSSSVLRQCVASTSRIARPHARILCRLNSSDVPRDGDGPSSTRTKDGQNFPEIKPYYGLPDPIFDNEKIHRYAPTKRAQTRPGSFIRDANWQPNFFNLEELINKPESIFRKDDDDFEDFANVVPGGERSMQEDMSPLRHLPIPFTKLQTLHRYPILNRRVVRQTGKGKIQRLYYLVIVGNGDGLVGIGEGKADTGTEALDQAFGRAVRNMDFVDRFEDRTLWTELDTKLGATHIVMRPRPVGFGLACAPGIHQVLKAAGIKDCSAKIRGSRNKINVIKAAIRVLHAGHTPLAMGDGIGGRGRRMEAGSGMRGRAAVELERGRVIATGRTW